MSSTNSAFATLNAAQRDAVMHGEPRGSGGIQAAPLLVIAGAGTGKTSTLAHRVARLLLAGVLPAAALALASELLFEAIEALLLRRRR